MSEEKPPSVEELAAGKEGLEQVETKAVSSDRRVILNCSKCGSTQEFPLCEECGEPMNFEENKFTCCGKEVAIPTHCGEAMVPKIV